LLSTRLAEVGSGPTAHKFTGRSVTLPNSLFLTTPVVNESAIGRYVFRSLEVEVEADGSWQEAERRLLEAAGAACGPELAKANQALRRRADREGMDSMEVEPRVTIAHPSSDKIHLIVRFPAPLERALAVEQEVLRRFLSGAKPMTGAGAQGDNPGQG